MQDVGRTNAGEHESPGRKFLRKARTHGDPDGLETSTADTPDAPGLVFILRGREKTRLFLILESLRPLSCTTCV
jgi:hypothetical protein